ncbi:MAG: hypothetical protein HN842_03530 [Gammaproteobacteria bacterium]|jgi:hypothetical protein|nr:hypothetical protein [Gammaproteobacteria bacterium]
MRTISLLFLSLFYNWKNPAELSTWICEDQMVALYQVFLPLGLVMVMMDLLGLVARIMKRRQAQEKSDHEWMQRWVEQRMKVG